MRTRARLSVPALSLLFLLAVSGAVHAQIPVTDVAHISLNSYWHYAHYLQFAYQIYQHYLQLKNQYEQIANQLLALKKLANPNWRNIGGLLSDLDTVMRDVNALGYALADAPSQFHQTFPGWLPWTNPTSYQQQTERALATMQAALAATARQGPSFQEGETNLAAIREQMNTTQGHQQALEQLATLSSFAAQEQLLTRQSLAVNANLQAVSQGYWLNREAQSQATYNLLLSNSAAAGFQNTSPGWTVVPSWWPFN